MTVFLALVAVWAIAEAAASHTEAHAHLPREIATGLVLLAIHAGAVAEHLVRGTPVFLPGALLFAAGAALRVWSIRALGPRFVSIAAAPDRRIHAGPYRVLRHPSELGLLVIAAGTAVLLGSSVAAIGTLALVPLARARIAQEEACLE